jgi:hypothetical protein
MSGMRAQSFASRQQAQGTPAAQFDRRSIAPQPVKP